LKGRHNEKSFSLAFCKATLIEGGKKMTIELETADVRYLERIAKDEGKTAEIYAREILENVLENNALSKLAETRYADWIADGKKTVSWAQVKAENGL
jgi:predicted DNA-binding protein